MSLEVFRDRAEKILSDISDRYKIDGGVHAETVVGAIAALCGEFALRASGVALPTSPGWIAGAPADLLLVGSKAKDRISMWEIIRSGAIGAGATEASLPNIDAVVRGVNRAIGSPQFPPMSVPAKHFPREWSPSACPKLRRLVMEFASNNQCSPIDIALVLAIACAIVIQQAREVVDPVVMATLAAEVMIGVSRMSPILDTTS